jgi:hypothetical protein
MKKFLTIGFSCLLSTSVFAEVEMTLNQSFVEKYKFKLLIESNFTIDRVPDRPNSPSKDGDLHIAGRDAENIGLATVAEIMNARSVPEAVDYVQANQGKAVPLTGVWRLWCEHAGSEVHRQGDELLPFEKTNPDHVFEIHPVTQVGEFDLMSTLKPIEGYKEKDAENAFARYEATKFSMNVDGTGTVTIRTSMAGFNYVKFVIKPDKSRMALETDGLFVPCDINSLEGHLLARKIYIAAPKGSKTYDDILSLPAEKGLIILGIPRMSLARIDWRIKNAPQFTENDVLNWGLPYEIVAVGNYGETEIDQRPNLLAKSLDKILSGSYFALSSR